ncbi:MAG TPA: alpha/beta fold hydrolase [Anaerolineae bacterium]|nr:alpha/beta fold hydrolase [Anaerolineae bacterium]
MPTIEVGGERIFYALHENAAQGRLRLVLVHGAGENHLVWPAALRRMADVQVYAIDLPGHGKSGGAGRASVAEYAAFLVQLLDTLSLERVVIAGHSMGGAIAQQFGLAYPARTAALILIATGARLRVAPQLLQLTGMDLRAAADFITQYEWGPDAPEQMVRLGRQQLLTNRLDVLHGDYRACDAFDVMERLGEIRAPTLVIGGTADQMTPPKYASLLAERIPRAQLLLVEGAGHMVMLEREATVARAVEQFLLSLQTRK